MVWGLGLRVPYRGTSLIRNTKPPETNIGPEASAYCRILGGSSFLSARYPCTTRQFLTSEAPLYNETVSYEQGTPVPVPEEAVSYERGTPVPLRVPYLGRAVLRQLFQ